MRIPQGGFNPINAYTSQMRSKDKIKQPSSVSTQTDKLEISSKAKEMQAARSKLAELPDVREDLVNELKQRIQDGSYMPDGDKIVVGIIEERSLDK